MAGLLRMGTEASDIGLADGEGDGIGDGQVIKAEEGGAIGDGEEIDGGREAGAAVAGERDLGQADGDVLQDGVVCGGEADGAVIVDDEEDGQVLVAQGCPALGVGQGEIDSEVRGDPVVIEDRDKNGLEGLAVGEGEGGEDVGVVDAVDGGVVAVGGGEVG